MKINAIITGATGMVGRGVLLECLTDERVESVLVVGRQSISMNHPKLKEIVVSDFFGLDSYKEQLKGYNACFFCLGVSSLRMTEANYSRITLDLTLNFAEAALHSNSEMTFCYVSGEGTDSTEKGRSMWARVKGKTENALLTMPFKAAFMFRPAYIHPIGDVKSKTALYNFLIVTFKFLYPVLRTLFPKYTTTSVAVGKAMIQVALSGYERKILACPEINEIALRS